MRNIFDVLKQIKEALGEDNEYSEIKAGIDDIEYNLGFKAPEDRWNYVHDKLIVDFIPPKTEIDYKVLSIWTTKTVEELKEEEQMAKEQEEIINRLSKITNRQILYGNKCGITIEGFRELQEDIETVLNMLKENSAEIQQKNTELAEKNAEIEKYKKLLADNLARELNNSIKAKEKADTDLEYLNIGWQLELEKKDKMIDLMAEEIKKRATCPLDDYNYDLDCENKCNNNTKECWKQYFERKVEDECKR